MIRLFPKNVVLMVATAAMKVGLKMCTAVGEACSPCASATKAASRRKGCSHPRNW